MQSGAAKRWCTLGTATRVAADLRRFASACDDTGRAEELRRLGTLVDAAGEQRAVAILAKTRVVRHDGDELTDLDGLVLLLTPEGERWLVLEAKTGGGSGLAQIERLAGVLTVTPEAPDLECVPGSTCLRFPGVAPDCGPPAARDSATTEAHA